jgi:hypothetical protein
LLWTAGPRRSWREGWLLLAPFAVAITLASAVVVLPMLRHDRATAYQSLMGFDAAPGHVLARLVELFRLELAPLLRPSVADLDSFWVGGAAITFGSCFALLLWRGRAEAEPPAAPRLLVTAGVGAALALLAFLPFAASPGIAGAARTQFFAAPGIALVLVSLGAAALRRTSGHVQAVALGLAGTLLVAVGTGRLRALQQQIGGRQLYARQAAVLKGIVAAAPRLRRNTLVMLLDETDAWWATFGFRHALMYLYDDEVVGMVPGGWDLIYPASFDDRAVYSVPWPSVRRPWRQPISTHRYDEIVVLRAHAQGGVEILSQWPDDLVPHLPKGALYRPFERVVRDQPRPAGQRLLD